MKKVRSITMHAHPAVVHIVETVAANVRALIDDMDVMAGFCQFARMNSTSKSSANHEYFHVSDNPAANPKSYS